MSELIRAEVVIRFPTVIEVADPNDPTEVMNALHRESRLWAERKHLGEIDELNVDVAIDVQRVVR